MPAFNKVISLFRLFPEYEKRVFGLDLMRALAIIFVVLGHGLMLGKANTNFPWIQLINGVELFFVTEWISYWRNHIEAISERRFLRYKNYL